MNSPKNKDLQKLPHKFQVMFAIFCARQVIDLVQEKDKEVCLKAIEAAEGFIEGTVTREECAKAAYAANAANAAYAAACAAAAYAANAANAANAAACAAYAAACAACAAACAAYAAKTIKEKIIQEQWDYYNELLNFEKNFEEIVLGK